MLNEDYREMLSLLLEEKVEFILVGAYALGVHGLPRATGDMDIWIKPTKSNSLKVYNMLLKFGANVAQLKENDFSKKGLIFQIGVIPRRIDLITEIDGVEFEDAEIDKILVEVENLEIPVISAKKLIQNKLATGREKDKLDASLLQQKL